VTDQQIIDLHALLSSLYPDASQIFIHPENRRLAMVHIFEGHRHPTQMWYYHHGTFGWLRDG